MLKWFYQVIFLGMVILSSCQGGREQGVEPVSLQFFESGPQLVRIPVTRPAIADSLIAAGLDVIVVERDYLVARLNASQASTVQAMSLQMTAIREDDLVQRLIKVVVDQQSAVNELSDLGIDIWEIKGDTVTAQVFDKHIREIRNKGYEVAIVEQDIRNLVKSSQK